MPTMIAALLIQRPPAHTHDLQETHPLSRRSLAGIYDMYFLFSLYLVTLQGLIVQQLCNFSQDTDNLYYLQA